MAVSAIKTTPLSWGSLIERGNREPIDDSTLNNSYAHLLWELNQPNTYLPNTVKNNKGGSGNFYVGLITAVPYAAGDKNQYATFSENTNNMRGPWYVSYCDTDDPEGTGKFAFTGHGSNGNPNTYYADRIVLRREMDYALQRSTVSPLQLGTYYTGVGMWYDSYMQSFQYTDGNQELPDGTYFPTVSYAEIFNDYKHNIAYGSYSHIEGGQNYTASTATYSHVEGKNNAVIAESGHAEGYQSYSTANYAHVEGWLSEAAGVASSAHNKSAAYGDFSLSGGIGVAYGRYSVALNNSIARGAYSFAEGNNTTANGDYSHAEGFKTEANGLESHVEGNNTNAKGNYSHAEGNGTKAKGIGSHAANRGTIASGNYSTSIGNTTKAQGESSLAAGQTTTASGTASHSEGISTEASGQASHAEGSTSIASAEGSHAEGGHTQATFRYAHSEGHETQATNEDAHAEGYGTVASGAQSHSEGIVTTASATLAHAEGQGSIANAIAAHAEGSYTHAEGDSSKSIGTYTFATNTNSIASGIRSYATGIAAASFNNASSYGTYSFATGSSKASELYSESGITGIASGAYSFAHGTQVTASGTYSNATGFNTISSGEVSHAEGNNTVASGNYSHAQNEYTQAIGTASTAIGNQTYANGNNSFTSGTYTIANNDSEVSIGKYNKTYTDTIFNIGIGTSDADRKNAVDVRTTGVAYFHQSAYVYDPTIVNLKRQYPNTYNDFGDESQVVSMSYWQISYNVTYDLIKTKTDILPDSVRSIDKFDTSFKDKNILHYTTQHFDRDKTWIPNPNNTIVLPSANNANMDNPRRTDFATRATATAGLMSAIDKARLDDIWTGDKPIVPISIKSGTWTIYKNDGTTTYNIADIKNANQSVSKCVVEYGFKVKWTGNWQYTNSCGANDNYKGADSTSGTFGITLPSSTTAGSTGNTFTSGILGPDASTVASQKIVAAKKGLVIAEFPSSVSVGNPSHSGRIVPASGNDETSISVTWNTYRLYFYGQVDTLNPTMDIMKTKTIGTGQQNAKGWTIQYTADTTHCFAIAYPSVWGKISTIKKNDAEIITTSFLFVGEFDYTNGAGYTQKYYIYRSGMGTANMSITIN